MGFGIKKIGKGLKKAFKSTKKVVSSVVKSDAFKIAVIGAAIVFTAGMAAAAIPAFAGTGLAATLGTTGLTSGLFGAGISTAGGLGFASEAALTTLSAANIGSAGSALTAMQAAKTAAGAGSGGGGFSGLIKGAMGISPGVGKVVGSVISAVASPDPGDAQKAADKRARQQDNRWGVNNYTGETEGLPNTALPAPTPVPTSFGFTKAPVYDSAQGILQRYLQSRPNLGLA